MFCKKNGIHIFAITLLILFIFSGTCLADLGGSHYFPVPDSLKDNTAFWKKIYTQVSLKEGLFHDAEYPGIIYEKVSIGNMSGRKLYRYCKKRRNEIKRKLKRINRLSYNRLTDDEKRIVYLFKKHATSSALKRAAKRIRFQRGQKERFKKGLERSGRYMSEIISILKQYNLPLELACLPHVESSFNPEARSKAGAVGLWQFMPSTGRLFLKINSIIDERRDPILSTIAAAKLLKSNYEKLHSWPLAITAYNHGLQGMVKAVKRTGTRDIGTIIDQHKSRTFKFASKNFYSCFLVTIELNRDYKSYYNNVQFYPPLKRNRVVVSHYIQPKVISQYLGISLKTLKKYNPSFKSNIFKWGRTVPKNYSIFIPSNVSNSEAKKRIASIPSQFKTNKPQVATYRVKKGDYLGKIAKKTGVSTKQIVRANRIKSHQTIYPGQVLVIPLNASSRVRHSKNYNAPSSSQYVYRVQKGDYLGKIAKKTGVSIKQLTRANRLSKRTTLYPGQKLIIPGKSKRNVSIRDNVYSYRVKKGDCLSIIAQKTGVSLSSIAKANRMKKSSSIKPGQMLKIPATSHRVKTYSNTRKYKVKKGDVLARIAQKTGVSIKRIAKANDMTINSTIYPGQVLRIPKPLEGEG